MNQPVTHIDTQYDLTTLQGIFDHVAVALIKQGKPSYHNGSVADRGVPSGCLYRGPDDCKCAAGHLIPDDLYTPGFEGSMIGSYEDPESAFMAMFDPRVREFSCFINDLQRAHDNSAISSPSFISVWMAAMREVACNYELSPAILESVQ